MTIQDRKAPVLTGLTDRSAEATSGGGATVPFAVTAQDLVAGAVITSCTPTASSTFPVGLTQVSCTADDGRGNIATGSFTVAVNDSTSPVLTVPSDNTVDAISAAGGPVSYRASAADIVDGAVHAVCAPAPGSTFPIGTTTVSCTASDQRGNAATAKTFTVTVRSATQQLSALQAVLAALPSLQNEASNAQAKIAAGDTKTASNMLSALQNKIQAQSGKKLSTADAQAANTALARIIATLR